MFKKKPNIKSLAPLRSSDRRKVVDQIIRDYEIPIPAAETAVTTATENVTQDEAKNTPANNTSAPPSGISGLRNALLPEGAQSARFTTTHGADLKTVSGTVYVAAHPGEDLRILWLKIDDKLVPTVYTLWRHPRLLPLLHTPDMVLQKMRGGADLMTPGLARGPPFPAKAKKGSVVAIAAYERPSVPVVVGICEIDVCDLREVRGTKGHAVRGVHWMGDEVWDWGEAPGREAAGEIEGWDGDGDGDGANSQVLDLKGLRLSDGDDEVGGVRINGHSTAEGVNTNQTTEGSSLAEEVDVPKKTWLTKDVDAAFRNAFVYGLHDAKQKHKNESNHGLVFPMPQSQFISTVILPYLPIFTPEDTTALQIKKSGWKNYQKFIKALEKDLLLKSKVRNGGETVVMDVDFNDRQVQEFQPYRLPKKSTPTSAQPDSSVQQASTQDPSIGQKLQILELLKPKPSLHPVFTVAQSDPHKLYLPTELRLVVNRYIEAENLLRADDRSKVTLNPILADALYSSATSSAGSDSDAQQALVQGYAARDSLLTRAQSHACISYHLIHRTSPGEQTTAPASSTAPSGQSKATDADRSKATSGAAPKITLTLEKRSGNKMVTRVSGLEPFYVSVNALADELQKVCAGATSVSPLVGSNPRKPVMEVMVQGPQKDAVLKALEKRGVRSTWVLVADKTRKKK